MDKSTEGLIILNCLLDGLCLSNNANKVKLKHDAAILTVDLLDFFNDVDGESLEVVQPLVDIHHLLRSLDEDNSGLASGIGILTKLVVSGGESLAIDV